MNTATITHDVNGIRISMGGAVHHWSNQSWLAEAHAQLMFREQELAAKLKDIRNVVDNTNVDAEEACGRIKNILEQ